MRLKLALGLLLVVPSFLFVESALSQPNPDQRAVQVRTRYGKGHTERLTNGTIYQPIESTPATSCIDSNATLIASRKENIWGELNDLEAASVSWLFAESELNLTSSEHVVEWNNSM